jgi:hypothetical protein
MENVIDPIASVRQGGAVAVAKLLSVNEEIFPKVVSFLEESFKGLKAQTEDNSKFGRLEPGPGQFGVVRRIQQDEDKQENGTMYSCGSLAPKVRIFLNCCRQSDFPPSMPRQTGGAQLLISIF